MTWLETVKLVQPGSRAWMFFPALAIAAAAAPRGLPNGVPLAFAAARAAFVRWEIISCSATAASICEW